MDSNLEKLIGQTWCKKHLTGWKLPNLNFTLKFTAREKVSLEAKWMRDCCYYVNIYSVFERIIFCDGHVKYQPAQYFAWIRQTIESKLTRIANNIPARHSTANFNKEFGIANCRLYFRHINLSKWIKRHLFTSLFLQENYGPFSFEFLRLKIHASLHSNPVALSYMHCVIGCLEFLWLSSLHDRRIRWSNLLKIEACIVSWLES